jgi:hypothetical protein
MSPPASQVTVVASDLKSGDDLFVSARVTLASENMYCESSSLLSDVPVPRGRQSKVCRLQLVYKSAASLQLVYS